MQVGVHALDVGQRDSLVEEHLVERHGEAAVDVVAVEHRHT